jgi:hypothetical protein
MGGHNNQPVVGVSSWEDIGEETRPGQNVWGGVVSLFRAEKLNNKNKSKIRYIVALDSHQLIKHTQQWGRDGSGCVTGGDCRGSTI